MIEGYRHYIPFRKIWIVACVLDGKEYIEIRTLERDDPNHEGVLWHMESPIGYYLTDLLYADLSAMDVQLPGLQEKIQSINNGVSVAKNFNLMHATKMYWLAQGAVFAPYVAAIERLVIDYENGKKLSMREIEQQIMRYKELKAMVQGLSDNFFVEKQENLIARYFSRHKKQSEKYPILSYGNVSLQEMSAGSCRPGAYADPFAALGDLMNGTAQQTQGTVEHLFVEAISTESPDELVAYLVNKYLLEKVRFRKCKYCGRYFGVTTKHNPDYCDRIVAATNKACKEIGPLRLYEKRKLDDPAIRVYKRSYKAHNARVRYGLMTKEEFSRWSEKAREKRDLCISGELPLQDFVEWLYQDKLKK